MNGLGTSTGMRRAALVALVALAAGPGCKRDEPKITGSSSAPPVELRCVWQPGLTYHLRMEYSQITDLEKPEPNDASQHLVLYEQECLVRTSPGARGALALEMEILSVGMERARSGQRVLSFDSSHDAEWIDESGYIPVMKRLVGGRLKFLVSSNGAVLKADGVSPWLEAALRERAAQFAADDISSGRAPANPGMVIRTARTTNGIVLKTNLNTTSGPGPVGSTLRSFFTADLFRQLLEFHYLPTNAVRVGEHWRASGDTPVSTRARQRYLAMAGFDGWQLRGGTNCARVSVEGNLPGSYLPPGRKPGPEDNSLRATVWINRDALFPAGTITHKEIWTPPASGSSASTNLAINPPKIVRLRLATSLLSVRPTSETNAPVADAGAAQ